MPSASKQQQRWHETAAESCVAADRLSACPLRPAQQLSRLLLSTFETVSVFRKTEYWCGADTDVHCCRAVGVGGGAQFLGLTFTSAAAGSQGGSTGDHGMYHHGD